MDSNLKEIQDLVEYEIHSLEIRLRDEIQASYNLGRDEVIEEIEKYREWAETYYGFDLPKSFLDDFSNKITSLKEKK